MLLSPDMANVKVFTTHQLHFKGKEGEHAPGSGYVDPALMSPLTPTATLTIGLAPV